MTTVAHVFGVACMVAFVAVVVAAALVYAALGWRDR